MKSFFNQKFIILIAGIIISFCFGCQKASINGDLDGRWQIMEVENDGNTEQIKDRQLFYNFYMHVFNVSTYGEVTTTANLLYQSNKITLDFPYINNDAGMEKLAYYYIFSNPVEFEVEYLSKKKLILKEGDLIITLRKF